MNIEEMRALCTDEAIQMTAHVLKRCRERGITIDILLIVY